FTSYRRYANLGVIGTNGEVLATAAAVGGRAAQTDHSFFLRVLESGTFIIGDFPGGPIEGKPVVNFGYPVFDRSGQSLAAVYAALDVNWFRRFGSGLPAQLPRGASWTELDRNGTVL